MVKKKRKAVRKDPAAKEALERFKHEVAKEIGVPLSDVDIRNTTPSGESRTIGNYMVDRMIASQEEKM